MIRRGPRSRLLSPPHRIRSSCSPLTRSGGLVLDHGWLRVLGSGNEAHHLASLGDVNDSVAAASSWRKTSWAVSSPGSRAPAASRRSGISHRTPCAGRTASGVTATGSPPCSVVRWRGSTSLCAGRDGSKKSRRVDSTKPSTSCPRCGPRDGKDLDTVSRRPIPMSEAMSQIGATQDGQGAT
jgi:hypothetical protein